ncbi:transposase [Streptomyces sp. 150FB]|uniref:transposase n=1 Tax=Streptomyces sp. 150FB TaxID=1576605 RepID=UPI00058954A6|nr:transposase [Streptomyces sp. 150FB]KIF75069.1 transposase [Streptomyces sp. 150FB]
MGTDLSRGLVPEGLWDLAEPLLPSLAPRQQGGGTGPVDERTVFAAVVYVLASGCAWRHLPPAFGVSQATARRRFTAWTEAGLWRRLYEAILGEPAARGELEWASTIVGAACARAESARPSAEVTT